MARCSALCPADGVHVECHSLAAGGSFELLLNDKDEMLVRGRLEQVRAEDREPVQPLPALGQQETIALAGEDVYRDMATRGLQYEDQHHVINAVHMGERGQSESVAHLNARM